jgi:hypothetical protein
MVVAVPIVLQWPSDGADAIAADDAVMSVFEITYGLASDSDVDLNDDGLPQFFTYALLMEGPLTLSGNMTVVGRPTLNADVHTNSSIFVEGRNEVQGFGTYVTTATANPARRLLTTFDPSVNPDNHPTVQQVNYPGLASHPQHDLARRQMSGFGGVTSFRLARRKPCGSRSRVCVGDWGRGRRSATAGLAAAT